jgi:sarcosine oxidase
MAAGLGKADSYDVVIVGGGVIGSAIAYFLAAEPSFDGRVLVVEKDFSYRYGSTGRSVSSIRQQFSTPENIAISLYGARFLKQIGNHLSLDGEAPALSFREDGYLFLASPAGLPILRENHALQIAQGADNVLLTPEELAARFPWLEVADLGGGCLGLSMEGWFDPHALLQAFRRKARSLGVSYLEDRVVSLARDGGRVTAAKLASGGRIGCGWLVDAAGPRAAEVAAMADLNLPVHPRKRFVFAFACRSALANCPLVIDPSGLYFRPEGQGFITGISPAADADPDCLDFEIDYEVFETVIWPALAARVPAFAEIRQTTAWAGHYAVNSFDHNAILGPHPEVANFLFANGFSGHGIQQSPAVGRAIMEQIVHGGYRSLDLGRFGYRRLLDDTPLRERNVV